MRRCGPWSGAESKRFADDLTVPAGARVSLFWSPVSVCRARNTRARGSSSGRRSAGRVLRRRWCSSRSIFPRYERVWSPVQQLQRIGLGRSTRGWRRRGSICASWSWLSQRGRPGCAEEVARLVAVHGGRRRAGATSDLLGRDGAGCRSLVGAVPGGAEPFRACAEMRLALIGMKWSAWVWSWIKASVRSWKPIRHENREPSLGGPGMAASGATRKRRDHEGDCRAPAGE